MSVELTPVDITMCRGVRFLIIACKDGDLSMNSPNDPKCEAREKFVVSRTHSTVGRKWGRKWGQPLFLMVADPINDPINSRL